MTYPPDWPKCPSCNSPALDGHITCGKAVCDESGQRMQQRVRYLTEASKKVAGRYVHPTTETKQ